VDFVWDNPGENVTKCILSNGHDDVLQDADGTQSGSNEELDIEEEVIVVI